jgi:glucose/arabinose dehydrogenase
MVHSPLPNTIPTEELEPSPTRLTVDDLPEPYASESARQSPDVVDPPANARLRVPRGFVVQLFADGIENARWLAQAPDGRVLVSQAREDRITVLEDADGDGVAELQATFADDSNGLDIPFGMAFADGGFFVGNQNAVLRFAWQDGIRRLEGRGETVTRLPAGGYRQHWTRNVIVSGEHLYVSIGSRSNDDVEPAPRATIQRMRLDGSERRTFASGLRNPIGLAIHPRTGELWTTVSERDHLGDDLVPDYLARVVEDGFYGWPYTYLSPDRLDPNHVEDGRSTRPELAARTRTPEVLFTAHSTALGLAFYDGDAFPEPWRSGAFVALRGSWNRSSGVGYEVVFVPFDAEGNAAGTYEPFVTGFLIDPRGPTTWGRPVGIVVLRDGSLLFTDETGGRVYRVSYPRSPGPRAEAD